MHHVSIVFTSMTEPNLDTASLKALFFKFGSYTISSPLQNSKLFIKKI